MLRLGLFRAFFAAHIVKKTAVYASVLILSCAVRSQGLWAQRVRLPSAQPPDPYSSTAPWWNSPSALPPSTVTPVSPPGAVLGSTIGPFDPYASTGAPPPLVAPGSQPPVWVTPPGAGAPQLPPPFYPQGPPGTTVPGVQPGTVPGAPAGAAVPNQPQQPAAVFPEGLPWGSGQYQRLFQDTGLRHTWLSGETGNQLDMNDVEISTTLVFQFFAHSGQGLRLTPGFIFHFLDGPQPPITADTHLPSRIYSAYVDAQWDPRLTQQFWLELDFRAGIYSDFNKVTSDSVRFTGMGLGALQVTPTVAIKLGAAYLDRLRIKLLPAGGFVWTPNSQMTFDIIFPRPRMSSYWTTVGNSDIWWYLGGEYGGGNWTIERIAAPALLQTDRIDINDMRLFAGLEWHGLNDRVGFFEVGYVFDRELLFYRVPANNLRLDDTFMLGAGIRF